MTNNTYFYSLNEYYREKFGQKAYKISLNAGMTCPNRDGTLGNRGCIFCSQGGSGDFAASSQLSITEQISEAIEKVSVKYTGTCYIAYFQAFTNTYAPVERLRNIYMQAVNDTRISGISIATRPDCLSHEIIDLLCEINNIKPIYIELGLQTTNESTSAYIRRGYTLDVFDDACNRLKNAGIPIIVHMIVGLPGESHNDYINTAKHISSLNVQGIKIQLLHVLKNTDLALDYEMHKFDILSLEEYVKTVVDIIEILPPDMVIHRITGDGPKDLLIAPLWSTNKKKVLNSITKEFKIRNTYQGKGYTQWL